MANDYLNLIRRANDVTPAEFPLKSELERAANLAAEMVEGPPKPLFYRDGVVSDDSEPQSPEAQAERLADAINEPERRRRRG